MDSTQEISRYIEGLGISVPSGLRQRLRGFREFSITKGDHYVTEHKVSDTLAFVIGGKVRHYYNIDGKEHTRWVSLPGNFMAAFKSFVQQTPSDVNLVCIEDTELLLMGRSDFYQLLTDFDEIKQLWTRCLEMEMVKYEDRVTQLITLNATQRYLRFLNSHPLYAQQVPLKYIASMLGIEPRHLSRLRKKLATG